jgi:hypothetical protein
MPLRSRVRMAVRGCCSSMATLAVSAGAHLLDCVVGGVVAHTVARVLLGYTGSAAAGGPEADPGMAEHFERRVAVDSW